MNRYCVLASGLALLLSVGAVAAAERFPISVTDPRTGAAVSLQPAGRLTHVVFFAAWCPPCIDELDRLSQLEARWEERGYRLVLVAVAARHTEERLRKLAVERSLPGRLLFDASGAAAKALDGESVPTHLLLDESGAELLRTDLLDRSVDEAIKGVLLGGDRPPAGR